MFRPVAAAVVVGGWWVRLPQAAAAVRTAAAGMSFRMLVRLGAGWAVGVFADEVDAAVPFGLTEAAECPALPGAEPAG